MDEVKGPSLAVVLEGFAWLSRVLGELRGVALEPGRWSVDGLDHLGELAHWAASPKMRPELEEAMAAGSEALWGLWQRQMALEPVVARVSAALFRQWGWGLIERAQLPVAERWLLAGMKAFEALVFRDDDALGRAVGAEVCLEPGVGEALLEALVEEHGQAAMAALDAQRWPLAAMHWGLIKASALADKPLAQRWRTELVERWLYHAATVSYSGLSRGASAGDLKALEHIRAGLGIEPDAWPLHQRCVELASKVAEGAWVLGHEQGPQQAEAFVAPSRRWALERPLWWRADVVFEERLAQVCVLGASLERHPAAAASLLSQAVWMCPSHPTAGELLGQALAALAARLMGAGRLEEARGALEQAQRHVSSPTPAFERLVERLGAA